MRISLNEKASRQLEKLKSDNLDRKLSPEAWTTILSEAFLSISQAYWREQIERHTPDTFLLERALKDPKISRQITEFLKSKALGSQSESAEEVVL